MTPVEAVRAVDRIHAVRSKLAAIDAALSTRPIDWHPHAAGGLCSILDDAIDELTNIADQIHPPRQPHADEV